MGIMNSSKDKNTKTYYTVFRLIKFRPLFWIINLISVILTSLLFLVPGKVLKYHFKSISDTVYVELSKSHVNEGQYLVTYFFIIIGIFIIIEAVRFILLNAQIRVSVPFFVHSVTLLRKNILKNILKKPGSSALPDSPGEAISRFRGDAFQIPMFANWLNSIIASFFFSVVAIYIMYKIDAQITIFALIPFLLIVTISIMTTKKIDKYRRDSRKATGIVTGFLGEIFGAVQAIKISSSENNIITYFNKLNENRRIAMLRDRLFQEILNSVYHNATSLGTGMILIVAGGKISSGQFTVGDFALFVFYLEYISQFATFSGLVVARNKQIAVNISRMNKLMENGDDERSINKLTEYSPIYLDNQGDKGLPNIKIPEKKESDFLKDLTVKNLSFSYNDEDKFKLKNINFSLKKNSLTVITGRIGSGKSTLLKVLLGLLDKNSGDIFWNDKIIENSADFFVPPRSAYTSQTPKLFSSSLKDNLLLGLDLDKEQLETAINLAVFEKDLLNLEDGLETKVGPKGVKLSGGQIQRVAAARMFYRKPELLVYDDLSSALDVETEKLLWERVFNNKTTINSTMLAVSHRKAVLKKADQIIILKSGKIDAIGSLEELLETNQEMKEIYGEK